MILAMIILNAMIYFIVVSSFYLLYEDLGKQWKEDVQTIKPHPWEPEMPTTPMAIIKWQRREMWRTLL